MYICSMYRSSQSTKQQQRRRRWLRQHPRAATINNQPTFNFKKIKYKKAPTKRCIILYHIYHTVLLKDEETRGSKGPAPEVQKASSKVVERGRLRAWSVQIQKAAHKMADLRAMLRRAKVDTVVHAPLYPGTGYSSKVPGYSLS